MCTCVSVRVCVYVYGHASVCSHYRAVHWDVNAVGGGEGTLLSNDVPWSEISF